MKLSSILSRLDACAEARKWAKSQPDLQTAWRECKRPDWMIWLIARTTLDQDDSRLRLMACDFAEAALVYVPAGEERPRQAIAVARHFAAGDATREEMVASAEAAAEAARAASAARASAAWAAEAASAASAWVEAWAAQSDIIRLYFPECPEIRPELLKKGL